MSSTDGLGSGPFFTSNHSIQTVTNGFSAVFLSQTSYFELLRIADSHFNLDMTTNKRILPCQVNSYMLIARTPQREYRHLWKGVGRKVSLTINKMLYNSHYGILVALVQLKSNFTCNTIPHIVLAKREGVNNALVSKVIENHSDLPSQIETLYPPFKAHGKIGAMLGSIEEDIKPDTSIVDGVEVTNTNNYVRRPEVVFAVEQPPPLLPSTKDQQKLLSFEQFKKRAHEQQPENDDQIKITIKKGQEQGQGQGGVEATGEFYQGEEIMKGPRGGQFIIKDGKKKYVPIGKGGKDGAKDVVYRVNILQD